MLFNVSMAMIIAHLHTLSDYVRFTGRRIWVFFNDAASLPELALLRALPFVGKWARPCPKGRWSRVKSNAQANDSSKSPWHLGKLTFPPMFSVRSLTLAAVLEGMQLIPQISSNNVITSIHWAEFPRRSDGHFSKTAQSFSVYPRHREAGSSLAIDSPQVVHHLDSGKLYPATCMFFAVQYLGAFIEFWMSGIWTWANEDANWSIPSTPKTSTDFCPYCRNSIPTETHHYSWKAHREHIRGWRWCLSALRSLPLWADVMPFQKRILNLICRTINPDDFNPLDMACYSSDCWMAAWVVDEGRYFGRRPWAHGWKYQRLSCSDDANRKRLINQVRWVTGSVEGYGKNIEKNMGRVIRSSQDDGKVIIASTTGSNI